MGSGLCGRRPARGLQQRGTGRVPLGQTGAVGFGALQMHERQMRKDIRQETGAVCFGTGRKRQMLAMRQIKIGDRYETETCERRDKRRHTAQGVIEIETETIQDRREKEMRQTLGHLGETKQTRPHMRQTTSLNAEGQRTLKRGVQNMCVSVQCLHQNSEGKKKLKSKVQ